MYTDIYTICTHSSTKIAQNINCKGMVFKFTVSEALK